MKFILVNIATPAYLPEMELRYKSLDPTFDPNFFDKDMKLLADSMGAGFIGLQNIFHDIYQKENKDLNWEFSGNPEDRNNPMEIGHWNYEGHKLIGKILGDKFKKEAVSSL